MHQALPDSPRSPRTAWGLLSASPSCGAHLVPVSPMFGPFSSRFSPPLEGPFRAPFAKVRQNLVEVHHSFLREKIIELGQICWQLFFTVKTMKSEEILRFFLQKLRSWDCGARMWPFKPFVAWSSPFFQAIRHRENVNLEHNNWKCTLLKLWVGRRIALQSR